MMHALAFACGLSLAGANVVVEVSGVPAPGPRAPVAVEPAAAAEARTTWDARCAVCHGPKGLADGPGAMGIVPKPRRMSDAVWQASVSDDDVATVIVHGGPARKLSALMTPNPELAGKPEVVRALVEIVRGLRAPHGTARVTITEVAAKPPKVLSTRPLVMSADATSTGHARAVGGALSGRTVRVQVEVVPGVVLCDRTVEVGEADVTVTCAPPTAKE